MKPKIEMALEHSRSVSTACKTRGRPTPQRLRGSSVEAGRIAVATLIIASSVLAAEPPVPPIDRSGMALRVELGRIQNRLDALRQRPDVTPDYWADAHIFAKGAAWALDLEPSLDSTNRAIVQTALQRAAERAAALEAGRQPWAALPGRSIRGFLSAVDGSTQPYGLILPSGYDPARPMRLDVVLHGSSGGRASGMGDLLFMKGYDRGDSESQPPPNVDYIEVFPMGRLGENAYRFEGETDVDEAIEAVCRNFRVDRRRIVLRGSSLGGVGTWQLGLKRPDKFVALGPTAGPVDTIEFANSPWPHFVRLDPLTPWQKRMLHMVDAIDYVANARMVPVIAAMGDRDPYYSSHVLVQKAFEKEQIPFVGLVDKGAGHSVGSKILQEQMRSIGEHAAKGTDPAPKRVHFVTWTLKFSRCHWIEILGLEAHYERAKIDATMSNDGSVRVDNLRNITRFAIHPPALGSIAASLTVGGSRIPLPESVDWTRPVLIERRNGTWNCLGALHEAALSGKRPGLQGPIDDAFATRFLCVRGTGRAWNSSVGNWAEASLQRFTHEWRRHYRGHLPVKNDTDVTEEDVRHSNLILFGDPGSNRWIRDTLPQLPVQWTRERLQIGLQEFSSPDHGVQLICPNPLPGATGRYLVLNSGHTYHDPELRFSYMVFPRLGDWAVMKVGDFPASAPAQTVVETVLQSGFFDENWRAAR